MDEITNQPGKSRSFYPANQKERRFGVAVIAGAMLTTNSILTCGYHLGFAVGVIWILLWSMGYLLTTGGKLTLYRAICLVLSVAIAGSFLRSDDGLVKFFMLLFLLVGSNLTLCLTAEQNLRQPEQASSLLDAPRAMFVFGWGRLSPVLRGLSQLIAPEKKKRRGSALLGIILAGMVLAVLVPLLISADAAFEGLMSFLPKMKFQSDELVGTLLIGGWMSLILYTRGVALRYAPKEEAAQKQHSGIFNRLTIHIVLTAVVGVYVVYLVSQLAYLLGGFAGLLPQGFTIAEYARRGFFEMFLLCAINLTLIILAVRLERREEGPSRFTKLLSLFIGIFSLFLVVSASARMGLYIQRFGLTKLRVLTEVIMLWLGITTAVVCVWRYIPKLPYMKIVLMATLLLGAIVSWVDVDTQIARYNVNAYLSGQLSEVDVWYLRGLSSGAVPYLAELLDAPDPEVAEEAKTALRMLVRYQYGVAQIENGDQEEEYWELVPQEYGTDLRGWDFASAQARKLLWQLTQEGKLNKS